MRAFFLLVAIFTFSSQSEEVVGPYASLTRCGQAIAAATFNLSPVRSTNQGIYGSGHLSEMKLAHVTEFLVDGDKQFVVHYDKDAIYRNDQLKLFTHKGNKTAITVDPTGKNQFNVVTFEDFPYRSYSGGAIGKDGNMNGYPSDEITELGDDQKLTDPKKIEETAVEIEKGLSKIVQNIVAAIILHAQQRVGIEPPDPQWGTQDYDLDQYTLVDIREIGCNCQQVKGMENTTSLVARSLVSSKGEKLSFKNIKVWQNMFKSLLGEEPVRLHNLETDDLRCSDL